MSLFFVMYVGINFSDIVNSQFSYFFAIIIVPAL